MAGVDLSEAEKTEALGLLTNVLNINTVNPPGNEEALASYIAEYLYGAGAEIQTVPVAAGRSDIVAAIKGRKSGRALVLNGHLDTVPFGDPERWQTPPDKAVISEGKFYGRGASDMKSGLCAALFAFKQTALEGLTPQGQRTIAGLSTKHINVSRKYLPQSHKAAKNEVLV